MSSLEPIMERNFLEYASYVIVDRAIPELNDGCKPVQRRILHTLHKMDDGKFHKVANVIGETMKLHPHGDLSIGDALVVLANKEYFIEKQGNFGNIVTGHRSAAARYIECRLTPLAKETLFNKELTEYQESYDGRNKEPVMLPVKLPVLLMLGVEGIAVGMATKILPHNFIELLEAQVKILKYEPIEIYPDFITGGSVDISEYDEGRGRVRVRAKIESDGDKQILIKEIPYSTTTESLIASIESAAQKKKIKIAGISDYTAENVEIEIILPRGVHAEEVVPQLYAYTQCEVSLSSNITTIKDGHPINITVNETLRHLTDRLREQIGKELELELRKLHDKQHWLTLEQIFIEKRVYKKIEDATTETQVTREVYDGMQPFAKRFVRPMTDDDIERLLEIRIRRISKYDQNKNRRQIKEVEDNVTIVTDKLSTLTQTTIGFLKDLIKKYKDDYPRKSRIELFENIEKKDVARQNIRVGYDANSGFFGSEIKDSDYIITMSEYDRVLFISKDGSYRIIAPEQKVLIPGKVIYWEPFDQQNGIKFTVVYRDNDKIAYAKKVHIHKFIKDREYELIKDKAGKIDLLIPGDSTSKIKGFFVPAKRQRVKDVDFDLSELEFTGPASKGRRVSPKAISRIQKLKDENDVSVEDENENTAINSEVSVDKSESTDTPENKKPDNTPENGSGQRTLF
ncbi:MAG: DNA topoisomerase IV subunit A [Deltaproteobacteria bacterium]|nr:DNA topoisomerase IV subunit A [Deltaproteobacteria bacterium]